MRGGWVGGEKGWKEVGFATSYRIGDVNNGEHLILLPATGVQLPARCIITPAAAATLSKKRRVSTSKHLGSAYFLTQDLEITQITKSRESPCNAARGHDFPHQPPLTTLSTSPFSCPERLKRTTQLERPSPKKKGNTRKKKDKTKRTYSRRYSHIVPPAILLTSPISTAQVSESRQGSPVSCNL